VRPLTCFLNMGESSSLLKNMAASAGSPLPPRSPQHRHGHTTSSSTAAVPAEDPHSPQNCTATTTTVPPPGQRHFRQPLLRPQQRRRERNRKMYPTGEARRETLDGRRKRFAWGWRNRMAGREGRGGSGRWK
jgi:hypothetical protein